MIVLQLSIKQPFHFFKVQKNSLWRLLIGPDLDFKAKERRSMSLISWLLEPRDITSLFRLTSSQSQLNPKSMTIDWLMERAYEILKRLFICKLYHSDAANYEIGWVNVNVSLSDVFFKSSSKKNVGSLNKIWNEVNFLTFKTNNGIMIEQCGDFQTITHKYVYFHL